MPIQLRGSTHFIVYFMVPAITFRYHWNIMYVRNLTFHTWWMMYVFILLTMNQIKNSNYNVLSNCMNSTVCNLVSLINILAIDKCKRQVLNAWIGNCICTFLFDVITYPCHRYLILAHPLSYFFYDWRPVPMSPSTGYRANDNYERFSFMRQCKGSNQDL